MIIKAVLYPVVVVLLIAGGLLAWLSGAGLLILVVLALLIGMAAFKDLAAGRRAKATTLLPPEERAEFPDLAADGVSMNQVEERRREAQLANPPWRE